MFTPKLFRAVLLTPLLLAAWTTSASAYEDYSTNQADNCAACHGDFRAVNYVSLQDGAAWTGTYSGATITSLHDIHRRIIIPGSCAACHTGGNVAPVHLDSSTGILVGGTQEYTISCLGCHGRSEPNATPSGEVNSAGLRQHHHNAGVTICADCHNDTDPATFTTVGEDVLPPYYAFVEPTRTKPSNPCNPDGNETFAGTTGLDNDGDDLYDTADTDCQAPTMPDINVTPLVVTFGAVAVGGSSTMNTTIQNLGTADLNVTAINLCAGTSTEFNWAPLAPFIVAPAASQTLAVTYAPVDEGVDTGCLTISSNDPDEPTSQLVLNNSAASSILRFTPAFIHPPQNGGQ